MMRPGPKVQRGGRSTDPGEEAAEKLERAMDLLAREINRFRIDAQRFLAGDLPLPPDELRDRLQSKLRELRNSRARGTAHNFRLNSLEAKLNSHADLLGRRVRSRELGEARRARDLEKPRHDPVQGVVVGRQVDSGVADALYKGLNSPSMGIEKFRSYLGQQAEAIRTKTGCSEIQFRVAVKDGKLKLKAKPIRE